MTDFELAAVERDGELYLNARQLIARLRERAANWDDLALTPDEEETDPERHAAACWAASAVLIREADGIDLACLERVSEERTST